MPNNLYTINIPEEREGNPFYEEFNTLSKTIESVNNFNSLYRYFRTGGRGPSTHAQQDLYRAMLVFACAGLDVFVKKLIERKLPKLINVDDGAKEKFKEHVRRGIKKDEKDMLNTIAFALIDTNPRDTLLKEYIKKLTSGSLQSISELETVFQASGLNISQILTPEKKTDLAEAFSVRNKIVHEMDINVSGGTSVRTRRYRTRYQRTFPIMKKYTEIILDLAQNLFTAYKDKYTKFNIEVEKAPIRI